MNNKDLFNAIHNIDENYIANAWDNTEADRPIVLRPERRSVKGTARNIMLGIGGTAAAAALGFAVLTGANGLALKQNTTSEYAANSAGSTSETGEFDPNAPIPVDFIAPDGGRLTYNDMVGGIFGQKYDFWVDKVTTAEDIAQMTDLFENFYDHIKEDEHGLKGFVLKGFTYLPDPDTGEIKRYNEGEKYCGFTLSSAYASFDENGNYELGDGAFDGSEVTAEITIGEAATPENAHIDGYNRYIFTTSDPALTILSGNSNCEEIQGTVRLYDDIPKNTPVKATISLEHFYYNPDEGVFFHTISKGFEPYNDSLKQWVGKGLTLPNTALSDDFKFLSTFANIAVNFGDEIRAVDDGEVVDANINNIIIKHSEDIYTAYYQVDALVSKGDKVKAGDVIGIVYFKSSIGASAEYRFTQKQPAPLSEASIDEIRQFEDSSIVKWSKGSLTLPTASAPSDFDFLGENKIPAELGSDVYAVDGGLVVYASTERVDGSLGRVICIEHGDGIFTTYAHLANEDGVLVQKGDTVEPGQLIGRVGNSGAVEEGDEHLHYIFGTEIFNAPK